MKPAPGLKRLHCDACGYSKDVEAGIKTMYHCAQEMRELTQDEIEEEESSYK